MLMTPIHQHGNKRKAAKIDNLLNKRIMTPLNVLTSEFNMLLEEKQTFLARQRRTSLLVDVVKMEEKTVMHKFYEQYRRVSHLPSSPEEHPAQLELIQRIVKESIVIEWPKTINGLSGEDVIDIDMAPLIHRARNVIKCRTSHPTMRIKVYAISNNDNGLPSPSTMEAFFRATLVKLSSENGEPRQVAGKMILTQREGTPASKCMDQSASVTSDGKLVASQVSSEAVSLVIADQMRESAVKSTPFKYENGFLCATFPEMGVTLNSMVDRRQLATRYAIQVEVALNIDNKLLINHTLYSHPFLIAITNDQTEPLLQSIFWNRLTDVENNNYEVNDFLTESPLSWSKLREALQNFIKAQIVQARPLEMFEICHIQCMILLSRILTCKTLADFETLEMGLYGDVKCSSRTERAKELRDRLLREEVMDSVQVHRPEFMTNKCISILDMNTELNHTVWLWLFRVSEMIQDVGHRLCPSPAMLEKKSTKTKKQMAASEEYQTMLSLFNKGYISLSSVDVIPHVYEYQPETDDQALLMRFCDENSGYLSIAYGLDQSDSKTPILGSISMDQIKDFKQGLPEMLIDEKFPSSFPRIFQLTANPESPSRPRVSAQQKRNIFHSYRTTRLQNDSIYVFDVDTIRINPLTGERIERRSPPTPSMSSTSLTFPTLSLGESIEVTLKTQLLSMFHETIKKMHPEGLDLCLNRDSTENEENIDDDLEVATTSTTNSLLQKTLQASIDNNDSID